MAAPAPSVSPPPLLPPPPAALRHPSVACIGHLCSFKRWEAWCVDSLAAFSMWCLMHEAGRTSGTPWKAVLRYPPL